MKKDAETKVQKILGAIVWGVIWIAIGMMMAEGFMA